MKKSFSRADNNFIQLFKHKRKLAILNGDYKIKELIIGKKNNLKTVETRKKILDTTSAKLDQIISKLQKNNSYITQQFFEDSNLQLENDELRERMKILFKKRKKKEKLAKKEKEKEKFQINSAKEAIEHMLYFSKKYAVDKEIIRINYEQNNKMPPVCRYTPSLNYIWKHIPVVHFGYNNNQNNNNYSDNAKNVENFKTKTFKNLNTMEENNNTHKSIKVSQNNESTINNNINSNNNSKEKNKNNINIIEDNNNNSNNNKNKKINNMLNNYTKKGNKIRILKKIILNKTNNSKQKDSNLLDKIINQVSKKQSQNRSSPNNNINIYKTHLDKFNTLNNEPSIHKTIKRNIQPSHSIIKYNISVPLFNKMTSRKKNIYLIEKNKNMADYNPNYDAIFPSNYKHDTNINDKMKKKKYKLRKILGSYNINEQYMLLPVLNNK